MNDITQLTLTGTLTELFAEISNPDSYRKERSTHLLHLQSVQRLLTKAEPRLSAAPARRAQATTPPTTHYL